MQRHYRDSTHSVWEPGIGYVTIHTELTAAEQRYVDKLLKSMPRHCYRNPKTRNEIRQTTGLLLDEDVQAVGLHIRPSRLPNNIPDSYDDLPHSQYCRVEHRKPWRSRKQRIMIAKLQSGTIILEPKG